jgi:PAS domain S-box-containing protein
VEDQNAANAHARRIEAVGAMVAQSAEAMLAADELSALRRLLGDAAREHGLTTCRVVLPGGQVVADAEPMRVNAQTLPARWSAGPEAANPPAPRENELVRTYALTVVGRGQARLEIVAGPPTRDDPWERNAGAAAIATVVLVAFLFLLHYLRRRTRAVGRIRSSLLALVGGESSTEALRVAGDSSPEADAWNQVLARYEELRKQVVVQCAQTALAADSGNHPELESACDALPQGIVLVDDQLRVRYANGAAGRFLRTRREDLVGQEAGTVLKDPGLIEAAQTVARGAACRHTVVEMQDPDSGGVLRYVVRPVRREDKASAMVIIEDITQQRVAEEARNAFVAQATHELRTPLTNMRLYLETALDENEKNPTVRAEALNVVNQECRRLERLVSDILSITEIEAGSFKVKNEDVRMDAVLQDLQSDYKAQAESKGLRLVFDLPPKLPVLTGDRDKLAVALHNLVGNALKYTPPGGQVLVSAEVSAQDLLITVADSGIGISEEDAKNLFKKFQRAKDPRVAKIPGSGLGLALAREVVRLYGGDILLKSELNKGSTFTVVLPTRSEAA